MREHRAAADPLVAAHGGPGSQLGCGRLPHNRRRRRAARNRRAPGNGAARPGGEVPRGAVVSHARVFLLRIGHDEEIGEPGRGTFTGAGDLCPHDDVAGGRATVRPASLK